MRTKATWLCEIIVLVALGLAFAGAPLAQTTTTVNVRNFEVISVDGNKLIVRDEKGAQEITVPDDFRFTVDGKKMSVSELKAGMKGTATITTTTTIKPVVVTEVREGEVLRVSDVSMDLHLADGSYRRFTQGQLDTKGVQIVRDGRPVRIADIHRGDKLTATIVTSGPPTVITEKEVDATLAESKPEPTTTQVPTTADAAKPAAPAAAPQPSATQPASPPTEQSGLGLTWYVVIAVLVALVLFFFVRRRKES